MDAAARAMQRTKGDPDVLDDVWANHVRALERRNRINVAWVVTLGACCVVLAVGTAVPAAWWGRRRRSQGFVALDEVECGGIESGATEDPADEAAASELMSAHGSLAESP